MLTSEEISAAYDQGPEALIALVASLWGLIDHQQVQVAELRVWVKALADQLATHSRNRSKPPASESFPPPPRSLRQPSGRPAGGQRGHRGTTLPPVALPDQARIYEPAPGVACGAALAAVAGQPDPERRPVFDLPPLKLEVTAHRVLLKECAGCGHRHRGPVPEGVAGGARSGAGVKSVLTYLTQRQLLPSARRSEIVADLWGQPGSAGLLAAAVNDGPTALGETATSIQPGLARAEVGNVDETGMAVAGQRRWRHSASTPPLTHYAWHDHRGATATQAIGILPACGGRASHDGCSAYWPDDGAHGLCHAPHWRALIFAHEQGQRTGAGPMKAWLGELKRAGASAP